MDIGPRDVLELLQKDNHKRIDERKWLTAILTTIISALVIAITTLEIDSSILKPLCFFASIIVGLITIAVIKINCVIRQTQEDINGMIAQAGINCESIKLRKYSWISPKRWFSVSRVFSVMFVLATIYLAIFGLYADEIYKQKKIWLPSQLVPQSIVLLPAVLTVILFMTGVIVEAVLEFLGWAKKTKTIAVSQSDGDKS